MVRLRDLGDWTGGNTPSKANPEYWVGGSIPWVSPKDMKVEEIGASEDRISELALEDGRASMLPAGAVLVVTRSGILAHTLPVAVTNVPVSINQDLKALTPKRDVSPKYVAHALRGASRRILKQCSKHGTTVASVETRALLDFEIPMVSLDGQLRVVAEIEKQFSRLDEAVANLQRVKANLNRYRKTVIRSAIASWPSVRLSELLREPLRNGHSARASTDGTGLRAFTLSAVTYGDFSERNTKKTVAEAQRVADLWAQPGDIYVERSNTPELVGTARLYSGPPNFAFIPDLLIRVRVNDTVLPRYLELALQSATGREYFKARAQGISGTMPKIDQSVIEAFPVPLPPRHEQERIVAEVDRRLSIVRELEVEVDANLQRAWSLRQATLSKIFGEGHVKQ